MAFRKRAKKFDSKIQYSNKNFQKIMQFYLFECPTPGTSIRAKTFTDLGWNGNVQFTQLKKRMLETATDSLKNNYIPSKKTELPVNFSKMAKIEPPEEFCVFLKNDEKSVMQSLYSAIRNSFAHGSFYVGTKDKERFYYFQNHKDYLKAEIMLKEETLLAWIDVVKEGYKRDLT